jgi:hypothetical protein
VVVSFGLVTPNGADAYAPLEVELSSQAASIEGIVEGDNEGKVSLVVQSVEDNDIRTLETDARRHFAIHGLRPGQYLIYAWPSLDQVEYRNPMFLNRFKDNSTAVSLDNSEHAQQVEIKLLSNPQ